jgi:hypothetical protein
MSADLVRIPFHGTDLLAVDVDGKPQIVLRPAVESLGLDFSAQRRKLQSRSWACIGEKTMQLPGDAQRRTHTAVDVRTFLMLLATINENNVAENKRGLLIAYQAEVADVIEAYWRDGGAINPRATEDQLNRMARQAQAQAAVLQALKGIVDPKHLEAKGRIVLARALGEAPELNPADLPLYVSDYLKSKGLRHSFIETKSPGFGKRLKARYIVEHDREPERHHQELPNGTVRQVYAYTEADRPLFDSVWAKHYANVVAESALTVIPGGGAS